MAQRIELGMVVKDKASKFSGTVVARTEYFFPQSALIAVKSQELHEGKPVDWHWFPETQVEPF